MKTPVDKNIKYPLFNIIISNLQSFIQLVDIFSGIKVYTQSICYLCNTYTYRNNSDKLLFNGIYTEFLTTFTNFTNNFIIAS